MKQIATFQEYIEQYQKSIEQPEAFWAEVAGDFKWSRKWNRVLEWNFTEPTVKWFDGALTNLSENCLDVHLQNRGEQIAIVWEPNDPEEKYKTLTYKELYTEVCRFANVLKKLSVQKGDRVCIYMPMIPEAAIAMLACARVGAIHSVVFAGFSSSSLSDRINDSECSLLITADAVYRGDKKIELKKIADEAMEKTPSVKNCVVYNHRNSAVQMQSNRDLWWNDLTEQTSANNDPEPMEAEAPLFILYTSGSTGKPKGVLHTTGGYMVYTGYTFSNVFNYREGEVFFCTADI